MHNKNKTCCFSGHKILSQKKIEHIIKRLHEEIDQFIEKKIMTNIFSLAFSSACVTKPTPLFPSLQAAKVYQHS